MNTDTYREDRIHLLETLAKNGLFCDQLLDVESFDVTSCLSKKPFVVRHASPADLPALIHLEETCWKDLQLPSEQILQRISHFPQGQYVALIENTVVAVMYTQRISAIDLLDNVTFPTMSTLHDNHGSIAQLLGVAVLPEFGNMQIANSLRYLVLNAALCNSQVHAAIAMTRCSTSFPNESEYERNAKLANDPILQFHINGGAKFVKITKQFRSNDAVNFGHSIMIRYELRKSQSIESKPTSNGEIVQDASSAVVFNRKIIMGESICEIINQVCGSTLSFSESFMSTPFMDFGLDSLKLMEVRNHLLQLLNNDSQLVTQTVLFDYPTPGRLLKYLNRVTPKDANPPLTSTSSHKRSIDQKYTVCGMSCRFPGGANTPDIFFDMLCKGVHFVKEVPKEWKVSTKVRYANFLDDESASTFDPDFFGVSHSEAKAMDPHQRILLEVVHEALAEAELLDSRDHLKIGVFVGLCNNEWIRRTGSGQLEVNPYVGSGTAQSSAATRISFILGLTGPSLVVDTACSSSLAATHVAMNALKCGDCDVAIVASADLLLSSYSLKVSACH